MGNKPKTAPLDVLIAEDDPFLRSAVREVLETEGYHCAEAASGDEALQIAEISQPRLVLLDVMMPGTDGIKIANQLHDNQRTRDVRVVFLTARTDPDMQRAARHAHCSMLLAKPIDFNQLLDALSVALFTEEEEDLDENV